MSRSRRLSPVGLTRIVLSIASAGEGSAAADTSHPHPIPSIVMLCFMRPRCTPWPTFCEQEKACKPLETLAFIWLVAAS